MRDEVSDLYGQTDSKVLSQMNNTDKHCEYYTYILMLIFYIIRLFTPV